MSLSVQEVENVLEDEWYIVRYSGETPEIALHSALYYLTRGKDGPQLELSNDQIAVLQKAAYDRFCEIVYRDIDVKNVGTSVYRGLERSIINYRRYLKFCERQNLTNTIGETFCARLQVFLSEDIHFVSDTARLSCLNCSLEDLVLFLEELTPLCEGIDALAHSVAGYFPAN